MRWKPKGIGRIFETIVKNLKISTKSEIFFYIYMKTCVIILDMDTTRRKDVIIMENLTMQELLDMQEQELSKINVGE